MFMSCSLFVFFCVIYLDTPIDNICSLIFSLINTSSVSSLSVSSSAIHILSSIYLLVVHRIFAKTFLSHRNSFDVFTVVSRENCSSDHGERAPRLALCGFFSYLRHRSIAHSSKSRSAEYGSKFVLKSMCLFCWCETMAFISFVQLPFRTIPFRRSSAEKFKHQVYMSMHPASNSLSFQVFSRRWNSMIYQLSFSRGSEPWSSRAVLVSQSRRCLREPRRNSSIPSRPAAFVRHCFTIQEFRRLQENSLCYGSGGRSRHLRTVRRTMLSLFIATKRSVRLCHMRRSPVERRSSISVLVFPFQFQHDCIPEYARLFPS